MIAPTDVRAARIVYRTILIGGVVIAYTFGLPELLYASVITALILKHRADLAEATA